MDGFRFDLASVFSRGHDGSIDFEDPPIFGEIDGDPNLEKVRLIAEPWEGNPKYPNYELGNGHDGPHFPGVGWRQWNDRFRTTVRRFIKGDSGTLSDFATRIYGSADLFPDSLEEFPAGDEFLQTQYGDGNPFNVDSPVTWIDWSRLDSHFDVFRFFSKTIAFRKRHPSIGRSAFWRGDVSWYGTGAKKRMSL